MYFPFSVSMSECGEKEESEDGVGWEKKANGPTVGIVNNLTCIYMISVMVRGRVVRKAN